MSSEITQRVESIRADLGEKAHWEDRYRYIIDLGKNLPAISEDKKTEEALVRGCQSRVWLHARLDEQGRMQLEADSDAVLVRGLVFLVLRLYSGLRPEEVLAQPVDALSELGLKGHLSPSRSNGLYAMVKQIQYFALALNQLNK